MCKLFDEFKKSVYESYISRRLPDWLLCSLVDDIYLEYYEHADEYDDVSRYMFVVFANTARRWLDGKTIHCLEGDYKRNECVEYFDAASLRMYDVADIPSDESEEDSEGKELRVAYESLSDKDRYLFNLLFDNLDMPVDVHDRFIQFKGDGIRVQINGRPVGCFNENGLVKVYPSSLSASKALGISQPNIVSAIRQDYECGGFKWKYLDDKSKRESVRKIPVLQYTKSGGFVCEWDGAADAGNVLGISASNIIQCCKGKLKSAGGYVWKYKDCK